MKKIIRTGLIFILCLFLTSCGDDKVDTSGDKPENNVLEIYYPKGNVVENKQGGYQLKQPDSVTASVEELMTEILNIFDGSILSYSYMLDENNNLSIDMTMVGGCTKEYGVLTMASVSETLFQIKGVENILINLLDENGNVTNSQQVNKSTFYFYGYESIDNNVKVTLYKPDDSGTKLEAASMTIRESEDVSVVEDIVALLSDIGSIPSGTEVNTVSVNGGICYLDLNSYFENGVSRVNNEIVVYALVNSVTSVSYIDSVQIIIDGEVKGQYRGIVEIGQPLSFNKDVLE